MQSSFHQASVPAMPSAPEISIIIPTFNEANNLVELVDLLARVLEGEAWEIIIVDDDSPDGTAARAKQIARENPRVRCLRRVNRRGLAGACIEGMLSSSAPYLAVMDADLQHDASVLRKMLALLRAGETDLVIGSRYADSGSAGTGFTERRAAISRRGTKLAQWALGSDVQDLMSGFFAIRRDFFDAVAPQLTTSGFKILADIIASAGGNLRIVEVGYAFGQRRRGESKLDAKVAFDFVALLINKFTRGFIPNRFVFFSLVGSVGVVIHLTTLRASMLAVPTIGFAGAQALATLVAMTSNFFLNNWITYRDEKLRGLVNILRGLLAFWALCMLGAIANVGVAAWIFGVAPIWWLAGLAGLLMGAVWNFTLSSLFVWPRTN
jgi:dolichol-phosphate mannosyltransferase